MYLNCYFIDIGLLGFNYGMGDRLGINNSHAEVFLQGCSFGQEDSFQPTAACEPGIGVLPRSCPSWAEQQPPD